MHQEILTVNTYNGRQWFSLNSIVNAPPFSLGSVLFFIYFLVGGGLGKEISS